MERRSQPPTLIQFSETVSFHDQVGFAIQFMNIVVASALVVVGLAKFQFPTEDEGDALALDLKHLFSLYFFLVGVPLAVIFAVVAAITIKFNRWVIASFLGFTALASLAYLIICFVLGKWATGIFGALIVIVALAPFAIRFRSVLVVEAFVNHSFHVIKEDPRLVIPALAFGFISTFWSILWSVFILMVHSSSYPHFVRVILILVLLASWVFTTLFLRAYSHIMMSGIVSVWYFHDRKAPHGAPNSLIWSAKRTIKLVGSAAMASVFSTIGALARFVFQLIPIQLHGNKYFRMASNFSLYYQNQSLADVMCHNHTFLQADVLVRHAIQEKIFEPIFELFFVERFMTCMALLAALIGGSLGGLSADIFGWDDHVLSFIVVGAALGFTIVLACLEVFTVMSSTTFVCLAQDPGTIAPLKVPELVDNLKELFPAIRTL